MKLHEFFDEYLENHLKVESKEWWVYQRHFELYLSDLQHRELGEITRKDIIKLKAHLAKTRNISAANKAITLLSMVYNKALEWEDFDGKSPVARLKKFDIQPRDRYLTTSEFPSFLASVAQLKNATMRDFFMMLLFTGQRRRNVADMRWDQLDFDERVWVIPNTKNGTRHRLPLLDEALTILARRKALNVHAQWVFPRCDGSGPIWCCAATWRRVIDRAGITDLRMHDLRRTHATYLASTGASLPIIGKLLNHKTPASTQVYAKVQLEPVREAMEKAVKVMLQK